MRIQLLMGTYPRMVSRMLINSVVENPAPSVKRVGLRKPSSVDYEYSHGQHPEVGVTLGGLSRQA